MVVDERVHQRVVGLLGEVAVSAHERERADVVKRHWGRTVVV